MAESDSVSKLNTYRNLKFIQAGFIFAVLIVCVYLLFNGYSDDTELIIFTPVLVICFLFALIAALLLHFGNAKGNVESLKSFICFGCLSYSIFDCAGGGFKVVRERIAEIEQGTADAKDCERNPLN